MKTKLSNDNLLLLAILFIAAVLRFWNYTNMPYMHDELSALSRTHFNSLSELITNGARTDGHPIGVQVFLYYWTMLFGENEMIVKLPFILLGLASIYIAYQIAARWFNVSVALVVASFMAVMQYMVTYSELARPYISGVFFTLMMVWCWSNYLFNEDGKQRKWLIKYIVFAVLSCYDHHFATLFALLVGLSGFFFITKINWKGYLIALAGILVLYIPHISITLYQFSKGGLGGNDGWLGKPDPNWLLMYFQYALHYSYVMYGLVVVLLLFSLIKYSNRIKETQKFRMVSALWFLLVFFIEYYYSLKVNPIIQFSTMIFVFPFLLMFVFSLLSELNFYFKSVIVSLILIVGIITLSVTRKHFQLFYHQPYQEMVTNTYKTLDEIGGESKATIELLIPPTYKEHYFKKFGREFKCIYYNPFDTKKDTKAFREFVNHLTTDYFIFGNPPLEYIQIIKEKYPYIMKKEEGFTYSFYCFSKQKPASEIKEDIIISKPIDLTAGTYKLDSTMEYGPAFADKLKNLTKGRHNILTISASVYSPDSLDNPTIVADIQEDDNSLYWNGSDYQNYRNNTTGANTVYFSKLMTDFNLKGYPRPQIKVYMWNRGKKNITVENVKLEVIESNPVIYGLFEPLD